MADPFDVSNSNAPASNGGISPDFWRNLAMFGAATSTAASKGGSTLAGSLGQGMMAATEQNRQNATIRAEMQAKQADAYQRKMQGRMQQYQGDILGQLLGHGSSEATNPSSNARTNESTPQESSGMTGPTWAPTLGSNNPSSDPKRNSYPSAPDGIAVDGAAPPEGGRIASFLPADDKAPALKDMDVNSVAGQVEQFLPKTNREKANAASNGGMSTEAAQKRASLLSAAGLPVPDYVNKIANLPTEVNKENQIRNVGEYTSYISEVGDRAAATPAFNTALENIKIASLTANPNAFAPIEMKARQSVQGIGALFGSDVPVDHILEAMTDLTKNGGVVLREGLKNTYTSKITNYDIALTAPTYPGLETPKGAIPIVVSQLQGGADYNAALNKIAQEYDGNPNTVKNKNAFIRTANENISPMAFMAYRYPSDVRQKIFSQIAAMDGGKQYLLRLNKQVQYAREHDLLPEQINSSPAAQGQ